MITDDVCSLPAVSTNHIFWYIHVRFHKSYLLLEGFLKSVNFVLRRVTRVLWGVSHMTQHRLYLQCSLVNMCLCSSFETSRRFLWGALFPWKKKRHPAGAGIITCEFTMTCEPKTHCTWENTTKVNPRTVAGFLRRAFSMKETRNVEAVGRESYKFTITLNARRVLLVTTDGIWKGFRDARFSWKKMRKSGAVGRGSFEFTITMTATRILPEKTQGNLVGMKNTRVGGGRSSVPYKSTRKMKGRRILHKKPQRFLRGWRGVTYKFTIKMKSRRTLYEKTQRFLQDWRESLLNLQGKWSRGAFYTRNHNDFSGVGGSHI